MNPNVAIIILNWNGWQDTIECLESLYQIDYPNYEVIVLDNDSYNESIKKLKEYCDGKIEIKSTFFKYNPLNKPIKILEYKNKELGNLNTNKNETDKILSNRKLILIKNDKNYGFAKGNNIGIEYAVNNLKPDYILLLNNDTVVDKNFLSNLINCDDKKQQIAAIQPTIYYYDDKDKIQLIGRKFNLYTGSDLSITSIDGNFIDCDTLNGAAMLIKNSAIEVVGLIDDRYFMYAEETDWCFRAKKRGFVLRGCKKSKIWHKTYSSSGGKINPVLLYYWNRNKILFYQKNFRRYLPIFIIFHLKRITIQIGIFSLRLDFKSIKGIVYGFIDGILNKKGSLKRSL